MSLALHHKMSKTHPSPRDLTALSDTKTFQFARTVKTPKLFPSKWPK